MNRQQVDEHFVQQPNGLTLEGPGQLFTEEQVETANARERERNAEAFHLIEQAGFIRYPLFCRALDGRLVEKEAWLPPTFTPSCTERFRDEHGMDFNIYVPSYQRAGQAGTMKMLDRFGVKNYYICIDPSQFAIYRETYPEERLVIRDITFRDPDVLDPVSSVRHPITMAGHAPLCNFTLALSRSLGESHFWFMDDDFVGMALKALKGERGLRSGESYDKDNYYRCTNLSEEFGFHFQHFMASLEELTLKMRNPGFVGLEKYGLVFNSPLCWRRGTRVFSFYLTTNKTQVTHLGRQNNDIVTSLELSKHGFVNMLHEGVSYNSGATQVGDGGQAEMYRTFGGADKAKVLVRAHPDASKITYKNSRIHHTCDFTKYSQQRLVGAAIRANTQKDT